MPLSVGSSENSKWGALFRAFEGEMLMLLRTKNRSISFLATGALIALALGPPSVSAKPGGPAPSPNCSLPATDLCTNFVTRGYRWPTMPIPYYINLGSAPLGAEQDIHDAFLTWQNELKSSQVEEAYPGDHSSVSFLYMGLTGATGELDGKNVVYFRACDGCGAASTDKRVRRKVNAEFDIFFNASRSWSTDVTCPAQGCSGLDLQGVATHEIGHVLDLYHVTAEADAVLTMYGTETDTFSRRDLGAGDLLGLRTLYPE